MPNVDVLNTSRASTGVATPPSSAQKTWHYVTADKQQLVATPTQLRDLFRKGEVTGHTLVWAKGEASWARLDTVPALAQFLSLHTYTCPGEVGWNDAER